jgi:hypothetical protein
MTADTNLSAHLAELDSGATAGKWCQFHPNYTPEAVGTKMDWDISHQMSAVKDGGRKKLATWTHASDAHFAEVLVNAYRNGQLITLADTDAMVMAERALWSHCVVSFLPEGKALDLLLYVAETREKRGGE